MQQKIKKFIKMYLGETMIVIGAGLSTYNIFNFYHRTSTGGGISLPSFGGGEIVGVAYYYSSTTLLLISIGTMLIVGGILVVRNRNKYATKN